MRKSRRPTTCMKRRSPSFFVTTVPIASMPSHYCIHRLNVYNSEVLTSWLPAYYNPSCYPSPSGSSSTRRVHVRQHRRMQRMTIVIMILVFEWDSWNCNTYRGSRWVHWQSGSIVPIRRVVSTRCTMEMTTTTTTSARLH